MRRPCGIAREDKGISSDKFEFRDFMIPEGTFTTAALVFPPIRLMLYCLTIDERENYHTFEGHVIHSYVPLYV